MKLSLLPLSAAAILLAACSSSPDNTALNTAGTGAQSADVTTSGITPGSQADLETNVGDRVFFAFDSAALDDAARDTLQRQATWLGQYSAASVTIEGHADERGTREYNLALGERRAAAARSFLESLGVDGGRMQTISYGEERPVDPGHNEAAWAKNRRAVTVVNATQ